MHALMDKLRAKTANAADVSRNGADGPQLQDEFVASGVQFAAFPDGLEKVYDSAVARLADCVKPDKEGGLVLQEGGVYYGCWLESTGTINAEILSRFCSPTAGRTLAAFARFQREDGLFPYKITQDGPVFKQIQLVTPPARSLWKHYRLAGEDKAYLQQAYTACASYDDWLHQHRNTRATGCIEAFCTFDTGHDLSPRFWHIPDTPYLDDPTRYDPDSPLLPLLAPDLTASVYCSRRYLARMAEELGMAAEAQIWQEKAACTRESLYAQCFDEADGFFYDVDRAGRFNRIQTDILLRVLACEAGDDELFAASLSRYLLNTRKFFAKYPFTSIAMDDPRFDPFSSYNTWAGAVNFLSLIRAPQAFELHGRHVELTWVIQPILSAMSRMTRFGQVLSPWTGEEGYTEAYSPAILCLLDFTERLCGILPTPDDELWFTGLLPQTRDHGVKLADETAYSRTIDGHVYELHDTREVCSVYRDGSLLYRFPPGIRLITDRNGSLKKLVGMSARTISGDLWQERQQDGLPFQVSGNEVLRRDNGAWLTELAPGIILPA